jgi:hypothetical protein
LLVAAVALSEKEHPAPQAMLAGALLPDGAELTVGLDVRVVEGTVFWPLFGVSSSPLDKTEAIMPVIGRAGLLAELVEEGLSAHVPVSRAICHQSNG